MTIKQATPAAIYLRISADPTGQQLGVNRQREDCLRLCAEKGWTPVEYVDNDVSASSGKKRPAYERMLDDIRDGRIGAVVCWHLDRLHRQPIELEQFMELADTHRVSLATVTGDVDLSTDDGRFMARIMGAVARKEIERKRARQLRAAQQKAELGRPQWRRAFGYLSTDGGPVPDPVTGPLVAQAYASVIAGGSITDVAKHWNKIGATAITGKPWTVPTLSLFLRAPRNAGLRAHNDVIVGKGTWQPLVEETTWRAAQAVLNSPGRARPKTVRRHLLTGLLTCGQDGCGGVLAACATFVHTGNAPGRPKAGETKPPKRREYRLVYRCKTCFGVAVPAEPIEQFCRDLVAVRLAKPDAVDLLKTELHDVAEAERLRTAANTLLARLDEIADERADGLLTGAQARRATERIEGKLAEIDRAQQDSERLRVFDGIPLGTPEVAAAVDELSADRFRTVLAVLATVTIEPCGRGRRRLVDGELDPDLITVKWA
ncbi:recombinase family protein [Mycolicibacterium frederiksbergense]|uniref:recombinase family protein n=1 Tax=Mycolicibacterium frederiksbergense TaxID=117567 RepID=UPI00265C75D0|nr:recombinase family protein [Mycolicibacterium frederiksbergense]MDO0974026.1 recombinase family protein [Mycolicibacterium frederiksbergense]